MSMETCTVILFPPDHDDDDRERHNRALGGEISEADMTLSDHVLEFIDSGTSDVARETYRYYREQKRLMRCRWPDLAENQIRDQAVIAALQRVFGRDGNGL